MHIKLLTQGFTNTEVKLEFSSQIEHTKNYLGTKARQLQDTVGKHNVRLPFILQ